MEPAHPQVGLFGAVGGGVGNGAHRTGHLQIRTLVLHGGAQPLFQFGELGGIALVAGAPEEEGDVAVAQSRAGQSLPSFITALADGQPLGQDPLHLGVEPLAGIHVPVPRVVGVDAEGQVVAHRKHDVVEAVEREHEVDMGTLGQEPAEGLERLGLLVAAQGEHRHPEGLAAVGRHALQAAQQTFLCEGVQAHGHRSAEQHHVHGVGSAGMQRVRAGQAETVAVVEGHTDITEVWMQVVIAEVFLGGALGLCGIHGYFGPEDLEGGGAVVGSADQQTEQPRAGLGGGEGEQQREQDGPPVRATVAAGTTASAAHGAIR
ncbi:MAG: hypothetical protein IPG35_15470 [Flavobacteriales bacterium]|nr:hypothetical protein [Flavobacteriales bacterium]